MFDQGQLRDEVQVMLKRAKEMSNDLHMAGYGLVTLWTPEDGIKQVVPFTNLITTFGDEYYAKRAIQGINSYSYSTVINGMKYGYGTNAAAKSGNGTASIQSYVSGSYRSTWDTNFPTSTIVAGTNTGWLAQYQMTWAAGTATHSAVTEAVITTRATYDDAGTAADTISRVTFTAVNKDANSSMTILWNHKFLGTVTP